MITDERITSYIHSLAGNDSEICMQIEREALADNVPIIRKEMGCFLKTVLASKEHFGGRSGCRIFVDTYEREYRQRCKDYNN